MVVRPSAGEPWRRFASPLPARNPHASGRTPGRARWLLAVVSLEILLVALVGCRERPAGEAGVDTPAAGGDPPRADGSPASAAGPAAEPVGTAELAALLAHAAAPGLVSDSERQSLEEAMARLLPLAGACDGCQATVEYVDGSGGGDYFRSAVRSATGEPVVDLHLFHRPGLPVDVAGSFGRRRLAGHPAAGLAGEHLFVWAGRFEVRAFARADALRGEERLDGLLATLPLDALARL